MKKILPLAKKSAKEIFFKLRENWPYFCNSLNKEIFIWREFFKHITEKEREGFELLERFLIFPFIEKIILNWEIKREQEKKFWTFIRISLIHWNDIFSVIILKKKEKHLLLSCFLDFNK